MATPDPVLEEAAKPQVSKLERMYNFAKYYNGIHR